MPSAPCLFSPFRTRGPGTAILSTYGKIRANRAPSGPLGVDLGLSNGAGDRARRSRDRVPAAPHDDPNRHQRRPVPPFDTQLSSRRFRSTWFYLTSADMAEVMEEILHTDVR